MTLSIPPEYQRLSQNKAAKLAGIPRTSFSRKYWGNGVLSVSHNIDGSEYVTFDELYRIFGEVIMTNLKSEISGHDHGHDQKNEAGQHKIAQNDHLVNMDMSIIIENERLKAQNEGLSTLIVELRGQVERERDLVQRVEQKNTQLESQYRALLESKQHHEDQEKRLLHLQEQQERLMQALQPKEKLSWWKSLFGGGGSSNP